MAARRTYGPKDAELEGSKKGPPHLKSRRGKNTKSTTEKEVDSTRTSPKREPAARDTHIRDRKEATPLFTRGPHGPIERNLTLSALV